MVFDFYAVPIAIEGDGRVERVIVERTHVDAAGRVTLTGETYVIPASLVVTCIGYRTPPIDGVPYDTAHGRFASDEGRIAEGLWCVGWARRGPSGTIGTNRPDGFAVIDRIATEIGKGAGRPGPVGLDALLAERHVDVVSFRDWQAIDAAEVARARSDAPREKFTTVVEMMAAVARQ